MENLKVEIHNEATRKETKNVRFKTISNPLRLALYFVTYVGLGSDYLGKKWRNCNISRLWWLGISHHRQCQTTCIEREPGLSSFRWFWSRVDLWWFVNNDLECMWYVVCDMFHSSLQKYHTKKTSTLGYLSTLDAFPCVSFKANGWWYLYELQSGHLYISASDKSHSALLYVNLQNNFDNSCFRKFYDNALDYSNMARWYCWSAKQCSIALSWFRVEL